MTDSMMQDLITGRGDMQNLIPKINEALKNRNWDILDDLRNDNTEVVKSDADLLYFFTFYEIERNGKRDPSGPIGRTMNLTQSLSLIKALKRLIIRCEWSKEVSSDDVLNFGLDNGFTSDEIFFAVRAWTSRKNMLYSNIVTDLSAYLFSDMKYANADFAFVICTNDHDELSEARWYIDRLNIPNSCKVHVLEIDGAKSMCDGYNEGMEYANSLGAKYKIYMHQDVRVINRNLLYELIKLFSDQSVGLVGMVGAKELPEDGVMWNKPQFGNIIESRVLRTIDYQQDNVLEKYPDTKPVEASMVDGCFMATQYDIEWRSDIFDGWDFYDASQSMEFRKKGYNILIPYMETPWIYHDFGVPSMGNYDHYKEIFVNEYLKGNKR